MMLCMRYRTIRLVAAVAALFYGPAFALAQEEDVKLPAQLIGYEKKVIVPDASMTLMWGVFILLAAICIAVLFKDAKRSHLD